MSELFYNAVPNATRVAPPLPTPRHYPAHKPRKVYLFGTCVVDLFFPEAGMDAIHLIEREGIDVDYPQGQSCCGQPAYTSGYTDQARKVARAQLALFAEDYPVVVPLSLIHISESTPWPNAPLNSPSFCCSCAKCSSRTAAPRSKSRCTPPALPAAK